MSKSNKRTARTDESAGFVRRLQSSAQRATVASKRYFTDNRVMLARRTTIYLSSLLTGLTFVVRGSEWLLVISLLPLVHYVIHMHKNTLRQALLDFYVAGFILCGFGNLFLFDLDPQNWSVKLSASFALFATFLAWMLICSFCSLSFLALGAFLAKLPKTSQAILSLPFAFAIAEIIRSYLFAIMAYGPHGRLSPNFNWGSLAVPASGTPLVYASRLVGFFGLTILIVTINICIYALITRKKALQPLIILSVIIFATYASWGQGRRHSNISDLKIVTVHVGPREGLKEWDPKEWPAQGTDLLVLPEYSDILDNPDYKKILSRLSEKGLAVTTIRNNRSPYGTNRLIYLNRDGVIVNYQDKTFLIPTGEYLPYSLGWSFQLIGKKQPVIDFQNTQQLTNGKIDEYSYDNGTFSVGALACSGISALSEYKRLSNSGADILVNSASLSFLKPHSRYHVYARNMARFQAVSNNRPLVQASRSGESYIFSNQGSLQ